MAKITLTDLANLDNPQIAVSVINTNMARIEAAIENTFSLDGTDPNSLTGELDANGQRIINLPAPVDYTEPARHGQLQQYVDEAEAAQVASEAAQVITEAARDDAVIAKDDAEAAAVELRSVVLFRRGYGRQRDVVSFSSYSGLSASSIIDWFRIFCR
jgi:hypothetical protein